MPILLDKPYNAGERHGMQTHAKVTSYVTDIMSKEVTVFVEFGTYDSENEFRRVRETTKSFLFDEPEYREAYSSEAGAGETLGDLFKRKLYSIIQKQDERYAGEIV